LFQQIFNLEKMFSMPAALDGRPSKSFMRFSKLIIHQSKRNRSFKVFQTSSNSACESCARFYGCGRK
jgi:hypothetical protein